MISTLAEPRLGCDKILAIAHADAVTAYDDLSSHRVEIHREDDGWHVEYIFRGNGRYHTGGGPVYLIDATSGEILSKKYYQ